MQLLTVRDLARLLNCSPRAVAKWRAARMLPGPVKVGRLVRWRADDIALFVRADCDMAKYLALAGRDRAVTA